MYQPYLPRLVLTCALSSTAIIIAYCIYKKKKTIISPDTGGASITAIIEEHNNNNNNSNNHYNIGSEKKQMTSTTATTTMEGASTEKLIEEKMNDTLVSIEPTTSKFSTRSLSGNETAPIEIINRKIAQSVIHVSDEDLDYEIDKAKSYVEYTSPSKISASLAKQPQDEFIGNPKTSAADKSSMVIVAKESFENSYRSDKQNGNIKTTSVNKSTKVNVEIHTQKEQKQMIQMSDNINSNKKRKKSRKKTESKHQDDDGNKNKNANIDIKSTNFKTTIKNENNNDQFNSVTTAKKVNNIDSHSMQDSAIYCPSDQMIANNNCKNNHNKDDDDNTLTIVGSANDTLTNRGDSENEVTTCTNEFNLELAIDSGSSQNVNTIENQSSQGNGSSDALPPVQQQHDKGAGGSCASSNNPMLQYYNMFDNHSDVSNDSGKGGSNPNSPPVTPHINDDREYETDNDENIISTYNFLIREDRVGEMIGRKGHFVRSIKIQADAEVYVKENAEVATSHLKVCTLTGTTTNIDKALKMIRERFPLKKYPDITLNQIYVPPSIVTIPLYGVGLYLSLIEGIYNDTLLSCLVGPDHLFMQQPLHPSYPNLQCLCEFMNLAYGSGDSLYPPLLPLPIPDNTLCAAYSLGQWYRAIVLSTDDTNTAYVKFLDYGGYAFIENTQLRQMREDFINLPFQATECFLYNVKSTNENGKWCAEAYDLVANLVKGKTFSTIIMDYSPTGIPYVNCYVRSQSKEICLSEILVERGFAVWIKSNHQTIIFKNHPDDEKLLQDGSHIM